MRSGSLIKWRSKVFTQHYWHNH